MGRHRGTRTGARPTSPHLQVWRWHLTMASSIFHRATGVALYGGALIAAAWAVSLAMGPEAYGLVTGLLGWILGKLALFGLTLPRPSTTSPTASGTWSGTAATASSRSTATPTAVLVMAFAVVATLVVWALAFATGAA